jgi:molybdopterin adenylyltransferase
LVYRAAAHVAALQQEGRCAETERPFPVRRRDARGLFNTKKDKETRMTELVPIGIVTVSDRASRGIYEDKGGPGIVAALTDILATPWRAVSRIIPDEQALIEATLIELAEREGCSLILTTGGTGPAPRDVTPEATFAVCERMLPGFGELMRTASLKEVPTAILSRQEAGTRGRSLIINLPGKPTAIRTCLDAVFPAVPYCLDLIGGARLETDPAICKAFRPKA